MSGVAPAVSGRPSAVNDAPSRIVHRSRTASCVRIASDDRVRHVVVEGQDHERVLARPGPGEVHRADVDVGLAEHQPDPPDRARPVHVAGDEHDVGRRHVEPVVVEPGDPRLAAGDRPGHDRRPAAGLARQREQRREGPGVGRLALDDGDAAGLGQRPGVDEVDPLGDRGLEQPAQDRGGQRRPVELGQLAGDLERQRAHAAARELGEEAAEDLGQRQVRGDRPGGLGREQRRVDRVPGAPAVEDVEDLRGDLLGDEDLGLGRGRAEVRRQQRVRGVEQRRAGRRLVVEDVDPGARRGGRTEAPRRPRPRRGRRRGRR